MTRDTDNKNVSNSAKNPLSGILLLDKLTKPDIPVVLLIRHAERPEIPAEETGNDLKLTNAGLEASQSLGHHLGRSIKSISASPITRCQETASNIKFSSESSAPITSSKVLGAPGAYVYDEELAWNNWLKNGSESVLNDLMAKDKKPPGLHSVEHGTDALLEYFQPFLHGESGYHICVSHDVVLLPFIAHLLNMPINEIPWPGFLQAVSLHANQDNIVLEYQSFTKQIPMTGQ